MSRTRRAGSPPPTPKRAYLSELLISASIALALLTHAPEGLGLSLEHAVDQGLAKHPKVASAEAELRAANTDTAIAKDGYLPSLQAAVGPENAVWGDVGWNVTASQMLYDWGRVRSRVEQASARERELFHGLKMATEEVALEIAEAYLDVLLFEARLEAAEHYIERLASLAQLTQERSSSGYADRSEAERASLELARAQEQRSIERGSLLEANANFKELVGATPLNLSWPRLADVPLAGFSPDELDPLLMQAPNWQRAQAQVEAAEAARVESKASALPRLNLEGSLLRRKIGGHMETDSVLSLTLRLDTMQGLSAWRKVDAAQSREQAARFNQMATAREMRRELNAHAESHQVTQARLSSLDAQLNNAREVSEAYQEQFQVGHRGIDDLLPIERELFEAERLGSELRSQAIRLQYRNASQLGRLGTLLGTHSTGR